MSKNMNRSFVVLIFFACILHYGCSVNRSAKTDGLSGVELTNEIQFLGTFKELPEKMTRDLDEKIKHDYELYVSSLSKYEQTAITPFSAAILTNTTGMTAIKIEVPLRGTFWYHVLIYEPGGKRLRSYKYAGGRYSC